MSSLNNSFGLGMIGYDYVFHDSELLTDNVHFAFVFGASINYDRCGAAMPSEDIFF